MIRALLFCAQPLAELPPPPPIAFDLATAKPAMPKQAVPEDTIVVRARSGEHPARLGKPPPDVAGPVLPKAIIDLGGGITAESNVSTHAREGVPQLHVTLKIPF